MRDGYWPTTMWFWQNTDTFNSWLSYPASFNTYSYATQLLLYPVFSVFEPTLFAYRIVNLVFLILSCSLLFSIMYRFSKERLLSICLVCVFFVAHILDSTSEAKPEAIVMFCFFAGIYIHVAPSPRYIRWIVSATLLSIATSFKFYFGVGFVVAGIYVLLKEGFTAAVIYTLIAIIAVGILLSLLLIIFPVSGLQFTLLFGREEAMYAVDHLLANAKNFIKFTFPLLVLLLMGIALNISQVFRNGMGLVTLISLIMGIGVLSLIGTVRGNGLIYYYQLILPFTLVGISLFVKSRWLKNMVVLACIYSLGIYTAYAIDSIYPAANLRKINGVSKIVPVYKYDYGHSIRNIDDLSLASLDQIKKTLIEISGKNESVLFDPMLNPVAVPLGFVPHDFGYLRYCRFVNDWNIFQEQYQLDPLENCEKYIEGIIVKIHASEYDHLIISNQIEELDAVSLLEKYDLQDQLTVQIGHGLYDQPIRFEYWQKK